MFSKSVTPNVLSQAEFEIDYCERLHGEISDNCSGVCIYYKSELSVSECKDFINCGFQESCWCFVTLESKEKLLLGAIYHSPSSTAINTNRFNTLIQRAVDLKCEYPVIFGDFNFATIEWENWSTPHNVSHPEFKFIECLHDNFLSQIINTQLDTEKARPQIFLTWLLWISQK